MDTDAWSQWPGWEEQWKNFWQKEVLTEAHDSPGATHIASDPQEDLLWEVLVLCTVVKRMEPASGNQLAQEPGLEKSGVYSHHILFFSGGRGSQRAETLRPGQLLLRHGGNSLCAALAMLGKG